MIVYDCEIIKAIPNKKQPSIEGIEYCDGWRDFVGMGLSVVCAYDYTEDRYRVFLGDNFSSLQELFDEHDILVGFNNISFDNQLLASNGIVARTDKSYDILREIWQADGLTPEFHFPTHLGYSLDSVLKANFADVAKSGDGAMAPVWWQQGKIGRVVDYCLEDVRLTKMVLGKIMGYRMLSHPKKAHKMLNMVSPRDRFILDGEPQEVPSAGDDSSLP
jgi:hypothetical protein